MASAGWTVGWLGKLTVGTIAVLVSLIVTAAYLLGYPEFQGADVRDPLVGNTMTTLSTVVPGSPIGSVVSHIAMHVAAVFHGADGTTQLPPHYQGATCPALNGDLRHGPPELVAPGSSTEAG